MARGWGRSEEDLPADKEAEKENVGGERQVRLRAIELSLARIAEQLARTVHPQRREALEAARAELEEQRKNLS